MTIYLQAIIQANPGGAEALDAHAASPHFQAFFAWVGAHVDAPLQLITTQPL